ncbi:MAG: alanyl-tRNA editing protein [Metallibacterium sp.]
MTHTLYAETPYQMHCTTRISAVRDAGVELEATVFYPLGGGQPGDTGWLIDASGQRQRIIDTRRDRDSGAIVHLLEPGAIASPVGSTVDIELDWARRHRHMRMHTCLHLLSAVVPHGVTGGNLSADSGRLDFDTDGATLDAAHIQTELARLITADLAVSTRLISGAELAAQPELIKTLTVKPPMHLPQIRLIEIVGADLQPCGGTHVARTGEIGVVRVLKIESKGTRNRRVVLGFAEDAA